MPNKPLTNVLLTFPTLLQLAKDDTTDTATSWIQLARTGSFVSSRYGKFSITKDDLSQMLFNFENITPKAPTELPVDFDHLSMDPKKPMDGVAAGWMKELELRADGNELWARVEWTPPAAEAIKNQQYRFISPSFVKNHTHKDGKKIGTTLLAAGLTNHPFLENMRAVTLYNFSAMGDLAVSDGTASEDAPAGNLALHLAELGQRVTFDQNEAVTPELTPEERAQTYVVTAIGGGLGDDAFVKLETLDKQSYGWYPVTALAPAAPPNTDNKENNPVAQDTKTQTSEATLAAALAKVAAEHNLNLHTDLGRAVRLLNDTDAQSYRQHVGVEVEETETVETRPVVVSLRRDKESIPDAVSRIARERNINLRAAYQVLAESDPPAMQAYANGTGL